MQVEDIISQPKDTGATQHTGYWWYKNIRNVTSTKIRGQFVTGENHARYKASRQEVVEGNIGVNRLYFYCRSRSRTRRSNPNDVDFKIITIVE